MARPPAATDSGPAAPLDRGVAEGEATKGEPWDRDVHRTLANPAGAGLCHGGRAGPDRRPKRSIARRHRRLKGIKPRFSSSASCASKSGSNEKLVGPRSRCWLRSSVIRRCYGTNAFGAQPTGAGASMSPGNQILDRTTPRRTTTHRLVWPPCLWCHFWSCVGQRSPSIIIRINEIGCPLFFFVPRFSQR